MSETAALGVPPGALSRWERGLLVSIVALVASLAWLALAWGHPAHEPSLHTARAPYPVEGPAALALAWAMWLAMVAAMMLPVVLPWILLFASTARREGAWGLSTGGFVGGYLAAWSAYSLVAAGAQLGLQRAALLSGADVRARAALGGLLLLIAGAFQFSAVKQACLRHCRTPLGFLLTRWSSGPVGGFRLGLTHGSYCLLCCWALMALSFVLGVMNLVWMAVLTLVMGAEKLLPRGQTLSRVFGAGFLAWGGWLLITSS